MINWNRLKLKGLNWNGQNLKDWIKLWPNTKGVMCNLVFYFLVGYWGMCRKSYAFAGSD